MNHAALAARAPLRAGRIRALRSRRDGSPRVGRVAPRAPGCARQDDLAQARRRAFLRLRRARSDAPYHSIGPFAVPMHRETSQCPNAALASRS